MQCKLFGNVPINVKDMEIDMLSLSGHKLYAPKGIGALYIKEGIELYKFLDGGHQEKDKRAGTENVAEIVALGKACELAEKDIENYIKKLTNCHINGSLNNRLPGNCSVCFPNIDSSELLLKLDAEGICASGGSACSSGNSNPSHVLSAIGVTPELASGALRVTFGDFNTIKEVEYLIEKLEHILSHQ